MYYPKIFIFIKNNLFSHILIKGSPRPDTSPAHCGLDGRPSTSLSPTRPSPSKGVVMPLEGLVSSAAFQLQKGAHKLLLYVV